MTSKPHGQAPDTFFKDSDRWPKNRGAMTNTLQTLLERLDIANETERFLDNVHHEPNSGCWLWIGCAHEYEGGRWKPYYCTHGKNNLAHRFSKALFHGPFEQSAFICHHCDNTLCVNPDHLYVGNHQTNMADMARRKRSYFAKNPEHARAYGIKLGKSNNWSKGEGNPRSKLTQEQVFDIRLDPRSSPALAKIYNVDRSTIQRIRSGKTWKSPKALIAEQE